MAARTDGHQIVTVSMICWCASICRSVLRRVYGLVRMAVQPLRLSRGWDVRCGDGLCPRQECSTDLHSNRKVGVRQLSDADQGRAQPGNRATVCIGLKSTQNIKFKMRSRVVLEGQGRRTSPLQVPGSKLGATVGNPCPGRSF